MDHAAILQRIKTYPVLRQWAYVALKEALWTHKVASVAYQGIFEDKRPNGYDETMMMEAANGFLGGWEDIPFENHHETAILASVLRILVTVNQMADVIDEAVRTKKPIDKRKIAKLVAEARTNLREVAKCSTR